MYECSVCGAEVAVDHVNPPVRSCNCDGTIYATMHGSAAGSGALTATSNHHDLSPEGELLTRTFLILLAGREFIRGGKSSVFVKAQRVTDEATGRTIEFDITGRVVE